MAAAVGEILRQAALKVYGAVFSLGDGVAVVCGIVMVQAGHDAGETADALVIVGNDAAHLLCTSCSGFAFFTAQI